MTRRARALSGEVVTGSPLESATKQGKESICRFYRSGKRSRPALALALGLGLAGAILPGAGRAETQGLTPERLEALEREINDGLDRLSAKEAEAGRLKEEVSSLKKKLIAAARAVQLREAAVAEAERRLTVLIGEEEVLKAGLAARQAAMRETLAALQLLARSEPPALIVHPDDAVTAARSAMLLAAIVPELEAKAEALRLDLADLEALRADIEIGRGEVLKANQSLKKDQDALEALITDKERTRRTISAEVEAEGSKIARMNREAEALRQRLAAIEREARYRPREKPTEVAASLRPRAAPPQTRPTLRGGQGDRFASLPPPRQGPLSPASGLVRHGFGSPDGTGGAVKGLVLRTIAGAQVVAPADGLLAFAGPVRGYGQMLIMVVPGGYHVILAGLERIYGRSDQPVIGGEPVGVMGSGTSPIEGPELYIEVRKDGKPIDPQGWFGVDAGMFSG